MLVGIGHSAQSRCSIELGQRHPAGPLELDDFEELLAGYGIVELQRTGRVALPKLDRGARLRTVSPTSTTGKAG